MKAKALISFTGIMVSASEGEIIDISDMGLFNSLVEDGYIEPINKKPQASKKAKEK